MQSNHDIIEYHLFIAIFTDSPILINHLGKTWLHAYVWIICLEHMHKVQQRNRHEKKETLMHPSYPAHAMQFVGKTWKRRKTEKNRLIWQCDPPWTRCDAKLGISHYHWRCEGKDTCREGKEGLLTSQPWISKLKVNHPNQYLHVASCLANFVEDIYPSRRRPAVCHCWSWIFIASR